jgi:hypothetical protein
MNIIELAKQAGIDEWWDSGNEHREVLQEHLEHLAALVLDEAAIALRNHGTYLDASEAAEIVEALKEKP